MLKEFLIEKNMSMEVKNPEFVILYKKLMAYAIK